MHFRNSSEIVYDILDKIEMPSGDEPVIFPKYKTGSEVAGFLDASQEGYVANLSPIQENFLGQLITRKVFGKKSDSIYQKIPLQSSFDRAYSDKIFRDVIARNTISNREVIAEEGIIFPDPVVIEKQGVLRYPTIYDCTLMKGMHVNVNLSDIFDTMIKAGLFAKPETGICNAGINFESGFSNVWSSYPAEGAFTAGASGESYFDARFVAAFEKISSGGAKSKIKIDECAAESMHPRKKIFKASEFGKGPFSGGKELVYA